MIQTKNLFKIVGMFIIMISAFQVYSQDTNNAVKPLASPLGMSTLKYDNVYIKITYGRPSKRSRTIFGDLVPYGKVWRTGANEATEITITQDVRMNGNLVKQGTYTLFTIPQKDRWTIILNSELGQWGAFKYDSKKDILRFEVPTNETLSSYEMFTIEFSDKDPITGKMISDRPGSTAIVLKWDKAVTLIPLELAL